MGIIRKCLSFLTEDRKSTILEKSKTFRNYQARCNFYIAAEKKGFYGIYLSGK